MRKRRVYLILGVLGIVLAWVLVAVFRREREPEYGGKRLSEWVDRYAFCAYLPPNLPNNREAADEAADAIRGIGTNALPYLVKWIRYEAPIWENQLHRTLCKLLGKPTNNWLLHDKQRLRAEATILAFRKLGPDAKRAIPDLIDMMIDPKHEIRAARAAQTLRCLGKETEPALVAGFISFPVILRRFSPAYLQSMKANGGRVLPALMAMLNDPDPDVRHLVTNVIIGIDPQAFEKKEMKVE